MTQKINLEICDISSFAYNATTTNPGQIIDIMPSNQYATIKYLIQASCQDYLDNNTSNHSMEILLLNNGIDSKITEYATLIIGDPLFSISSDIALSDLRLTITPFRENTLVKVYKIAIGA